MSSSYADLTRNDPNALKRWLQARRLRAALALPPAELEGWITSALAEARRRGITGRNETPFLLAELARLSQGRTVTLNEALVLDNARLAARLAAAWQDDSP